MCDLGTIHVKIKFQYRTWKLSYIRIFKFILYAVFHQRLLPQPSAKDILPRSFRGLNPVRFLMNNYHRKLLHKNAKKKRNSVDFQEISFHLHWKWTAELCNFSSLDVLSFLVSIPRRGLNQPLFSANSRGIWQVLLNHLRPGHISQPQISGFFFAGKFPLSACQINGIGWDLRAPFERCSHIETNSWLHLILSLWSTLEAWGGLWKVYMFLGFVGNVMGQSPTRKVIGRRHPKHIKLDFSSAQTGLDKVILKTRVILFGTFNRKFLQCTPLEKIPKSSCFCGFADVAKFQIKKLKNNTKNSNAKHVRMDLCWQCPMRCILFFGRSGGRFYRRHCGKGAVKSFFKRTTSLTAETERTSEKMASLAILRDIS